MGTPILQVRHPFVTPGMLSYLWAKTVQKLKTSLSAFGKEKARAGTDHPIQHSIRRSKVKKVDQKLLRLDIQTEVKRLYCQVPNLSYYILYRKLQALNPTHCLKFLEIQTWAQEPKKFFQISCEPPAAAGSSYMQLRVAHEAKQTISSGTGVGVGDLATNGMTCRLRWSRSWSSSRVWRPSPSGRGHAAGLGSNGRSTTSAQRFSRSWYQERLRDQN